MHDHALVYRAICAASICIFIATACDLYGVVDRPRNGLERCLHLEVHKYRSLFDIVMALTGTCVIVLL